MRLQTGTQLVVLDVTVLDKAGRPVTSGLSRDDFHITEDRQPQRIRNFEAPSEHVNDSHGSAESKLPTMVFVLDELNSVWKNGGDTQFFSDEAQARSDLMAYLADEPKELRQWSELLALTHHGLETVVSLTRNRDEMMGVLAKRDPGLPTTHLDSLESQDSTSAKRSFTALWTLALAGRSLPGRKSIVWLGLGGPGLDAKLMLPKGRAAFEKLSQRITDLLIESRTTLTVLGPGVSLYSGQAKNLLDRTHAAAQQETLQFEDYSGFGSFVSTSGGDWLTGNDLRGELHQVVAYGSAYYTLTYRPENRSQDGTYRSLHVTVTGPGHEGYTVHTKAGYYELPFGGEKDRVTQEQTELEMAAFEPTPMTGLHVSMERLERLVGSNAVRFVLRIDSNDLRWSAPTDSTSQEAEVTVEAVALSRYPTNKVLEARAANFRMRAPLSMASGAPVHAQMRRQGTTDGEPKEAGIKSMVTFAFPIPPKTDTIRLLVRDVADGHVGSLTLTPADLKAAPQVVPDLPSTQKHAPGGL